MTRATFLAAVLILAPIAVTAESVHAEKTFQNHGRVEMQLSGGDYEVRAGAADKIVVTATSDQDFGGKAVRADVTILGTIAKIHTDGPHSNFHVVIEIPPETNLYIRLTAGYMRLKGITGNKDIESHAGDLSIDVGDPDSYRTVDASVGAGDLNAPCFGVNKGGLFRSFRQERKGHFTLHAHLGAGDLNLH